MTNSDNTFGTYNKTTVITSQSPDSTQTYVNFANVQAAKDHFFSADAQTVYDECCTNLQWALVANEDSNNTMLKCTYDFGTKGSADIAEADDWASQFATRMAALSSVSANGITDQIITDQDSAEHLF